MKKPSDVIENPQNCFGDVLVNFCDGADWSIIGVNWSLPIYKVVRLPPKKLHRTALKNWWFLNKPKVYNTDPLYQALSRRPLTVPLITVSNHDSCFDDPGLWAILKWRTLLNGPRMRWSMAAHDICFTNSVHSYFFMLGKCIPVVRGKGVFQDAVNFCIEILARGEWLHVFPEGKVNMTKELLRLKWGIGRMVYESPVVPIVIPLWHIGMEEILPNYPPYYLRTGKKITVNIGDPIDLSDLVKRLREAKVSDEEARKAITDKIQVELYKLKEATEELHKKFNS